MEMTCLPVGFFFSIVVSVSSCRSTGIGSKCSERECKRVRPNHLRVQQSYPEPLCVITVATVDQAS